MSLAEAAIRGIVDTMAFRASASPYLVLDARLRIRAGNLAYQRATLHEISDITGELMFDVFPDNPATPEARGVERLGSSFEQVLRSGEPDRMEMQRYDVLSEHGDFVEKSWLPANSPIRDAEGKTVGILHHVEDVTHLLVATALERDLLTTHDATGEQPVVGTPTLVDALIRDSVVRRARARMLMDHSREALERVNRRIDAADQPRSGGSLRA